METSPQSEQRVDAGKLQALVGSIFLRCEMEQADAELLADSLVFADLSGVHSHGVSACLSMSKN